MKDLICGSLEEFCEALQNDTMTIEEAVEELGDIANKADAYLNFHYSILEVIHKTGISEKDIAATLEAEKIWKRKLCTLNTSWGLNRN